MNRIGYLNWFFKRAYERLGGLGKIALACFGLVLLLVLFKLLPNYWEYQQMTQRISQAQQPDTQRILSRDEQITQLLKHLPPASERATQAKQLMEIAAVHNLLPKDVTYRTETLVNTTIDKYRIQFTLSSDYPSLQSFLNTVLTTLPNAAIESLDMRREQADEALVTTRVLLVLYFVADAHNGGAQ